MTILHIAGGGHHWEAISENDTGKKVTRPQQIYTMKQKKLDVY